MWGYERVGFYVPCSHLRDVVSKEVYGWWITCVDYERGGPWSWTTSGEVRRGRTMSGQIGGSIGIPKTNLSMYLV